MPAATARTKTEASGRPCIFGGTGLVGLEKIERSGHIRVDKGLRGKSRDVRLMQGACVHDRLDAVVAKYTFDQRLIGDRTDHYGLAAWDHVKACYAVTCPPQGRRQKPPEPPRGTGEQKTHRGSNSNNPSSIRTNRR